MPKNDYDRPLEATPSPSGFERLRDRISMWWIGPIPTGPILLFIVLFAVPVVVVWHVLDLLPYWVLKALLIAVTAVLWSAIREWQREKDSLKRHFADQEP